MDMNHLHLGSRDVAASQAFYERHFGFRKKKSTLPGGRDKDNASWAYTIRVFPCQGGQRTGEMLCEVDPVVDWEP